MTNSKQPKTLQHDFALSPLRSHFSKTPNPPGANRLIDLPANDFFDTEDEFNVVAAALWTLCVRWDKLEDEKRPRTREGLRGEWILKNRDGIMDYLCNKVEPPFAEYQMHQDVAALSDELLAQTLPEEGREVAAVREKKEAEAKAGKGK